MNENQQNSTNVAIAKEAIDQTTGLTPTQEKCAVMLASGVSITEIARELGLDRSTMYLWLKKVTFQCYFNHLRKEIQEKLTGNLFELHSSAIDAISKCLESDNESIRLKTAIWIVERLASIQVEEDNVRKVLEKECTHSQLTNGWDTYFNEKEYYQRLAEEGLAEY